MTCYTKKYHRHPETLQQVRKAFAILPTEGEPPFRPARRRHHLPTAWDDIPRDISCKNWKRYRVTQYR